jgi:hypothetical protein
MVDLRVPILMSPQNASPHCVVKKCIKHGEKPLAFTNLEPSPHLHLKNGLDFPRSHLGIHKV